MWHAHIITHDMWVIVHRYGNKLGKFYIYMYLVLILYSWVPIILSNTITIWISIKHVGIYINGYIIIGKFFECQTAVLEVITTICPP